MLLKALSVITTLLSILVSAQQPVIDFTSPYIVSLTAETFDKINEGTWFVEFYSPRCGHCQRLAPTYKKVAEDLGLLRDSHGLFLANVDCSVNGELCDAQMIDGYPTLLLYHAGRKMEEYLGSRDYDSLKEFLQTNADKYRLFKEDVIELSAKTFAEKVVKQGTDGKSNDGSKWFVKFYTTWCGHCQNLKPKYEELAKMFREQRHERNFYMAEVDCDVFNDVCKDNGIQGYPTMLFFDGAKKGAKYEGAHDVESIKQFLMRKLSIDSLDASSQKKNKASPKKIERKEDQDFVVQTGSASSNTRAINQEGKVVELTESSFDTLVGSGPWLVEFFAPWCGHCKQLKPTYENLAAELKGQVNIGSVDCTAHGALQNKYGVRGYPTIKFFYNGAYISDFKGPRSLANLKEFASRLSSPSVLPIDKDDYSKLSSSHVSFIFLSLKEELPPFLDIIARENALDASFYFSKDQSLFDQFQLAKDSSHLVVVRDGKVTEYSTSAAKLEKESVEKWILVKKYPKLVQLTPRNSADLFHINAWIVLAFLDPRSSSFMKQKEVLTALADIEEQNKQHVIVSWLDAIEWENHMTSTFGVSLKSVPSAVIVHPDGDEYFDTAADEQKIGFDMIRLRESLRDAINGSIKSKHVKGSIGSFVKYFTNMGWDSPIVLAAGVFLLAGLIYLCFCGTGGYEPLNTKAD